MKHWKNFDWQLIAIPFILVAFSTAMLYAISHWATAVPHSTPYKQALYFALGIILFWFFTNIDYKTVRSLIYPAYVLVILSLVFVSVLGHSSYGSQRWINLGFIQLQPSEPAKLIVALALARFLTDREHRMGELTTLLGSLIIVGVPALLVLRQPDLGTAMVLGAVWFAVMVMASTPPVYLGSVVAVSGLMAPLAFKMMKPYQVNRLTSFLNPNKDPLGSGYNIIHARIAVGSGGLVGEWFSKTTQSRLNFLTVQDKDFIFSVIAEQIGFLGIMVLFLLFGLLFMRIARVAFMSADTFGRLAATGILAMFLVQTFVNVGMNIGIMPVTGIPLPLVSYGGSSLLTSLAALGILESILLRHQKLVFSAG